MGCLGLHFALDAGQVAALKAVDEEDRVDFVRQEWRPTRPELGRGYKSWGSMPWDEGIATTSGLKP